MSKQQRFVDWRRFGTRRARRALVAGGAGLGAVLVASAAAGSSGQQPVAPATPEAVTPEAVTQLQSEIDAMVAAGLAADHPKVRMLQDEVTALVDGTAAGSTPEPGIELRAGTEERPADTPEEAAAVAGEVAPETVGVAGPVECEPVPQHLSAAEVDDATCLSVPQPDGSARYLAVKPEGHVHVVEFDRGGQVERRADEQLPAGRTPADTELVPDPAGDVELRVGEEPVAVMDVK